MRVTVVGAGNAGCTAAADLALGGADVTLFELPRFAANLNPIRERGGIKLINNRIDGTGRSGEGRGIRLTADPADAAREADAILVATQSAAHEEVARILASHLRSGQIVLLFTGYGGSLLVRKVLHDVGVSSDVIVAETVTLPYLCRIQAPGQDAFANLVADL